MKKFRASKFEGNNLIIYNLFNDETLILRWEEGWSNETFLKENDISIQANFYDLCPSNIEISEEEDDKFKWPYCMIIYDIRLFYIISHDEIDIGISDEITDLIYIEKNDLQLMAFFKEYCLPYLS